MRYIDLFAGIGGFRYGIEQSELEAKCVWSCEKDKYARQVYRKHWEEPAGDIREIQTEQIPEHDLICGGFPCQSFSIAGNRKGFEDTRGTLFHEICRIARDKRPAWLLLENVQGLLSAQNREAFAVVLESLDECGYNASWQVLNSKNFGVPQNRPRVFIIGHLRAEGGHPFKILPVRGSEEEYDGTSGETQKEGARVRDRYSGTIDRNYHKTGGSRTHIKEDEKQVEETEITKGEDMPQSQKIYKPDGLSTTITGRGGGQGAKTGLYIEDEDKDTDGNEENEVKKEIDFKFQKSVYSKDGISPTVREGHGDVVRILDDYNQNIKDDEIVPAVRPTNANDAPRNASKIIENELKELTEDESQGYRVYDSDGISKTISGNAGGLGAKTGLYLQNAEIRKLTPKECERLQGFPDGWTETGLDENSKDVEISDTQRYKLLGNAVTTNVVEFIANRFYKLLQEG